MVLVKRIYLCYQTKSVTWMKIITALFFLMMAFSCEGLIRPEVVPRSLNAEASPKVVQLPSIDSLTIPAFFKALIGEHREDFYRLDSTRYLSFCAEHQVIATDTSNRSPYWGLYILHKIFTAESASNCSKGEILDIPYMWHWVEPNPRHAIYTTNDNRLLKNSRPPKEFARYQSMADVDRTPYLFLSDLVAAAPKYYTEECDTFSTFGWCSEREMAFVALSKLLGFRGKVVAEGIHSWSEFILPMRLVSGKTQHFKIAIDNTFDSFHIERIDSKDIPQWERYLGDVQQRHWYNNQATSSAELNRIKKHRVPIRAMSRIKKAVGQYVDKKMASWDVDE